MARPYTLTVRNGPKVQRERFVELGAALTALEARMDELAHTTRRAPVDLRYKRFEPVQQVAARGEVSGPRRLHVGVDLRGDGSAEAYTGRLRRRLVVQRDGESPYDALRRSLQG
jgi:hypothetical protein